MLESAREEEKPELTEKQAESEFALAHAFLGGAVSRIPEPMRDMIRWAEEMKATHGKKN